MVRKIIAIFLISMLMLGMLHTNVKADDTVNTDSYDITKCVLYAQQDTDAITINARNLSINGDVISGG